VPTARRAAPWAATAALAVAVSVILSGCTPAPPPAPTHWSKPGATYDDYLKDRYACIQDSRAQVSSMDMYKGSGSAASGQVISASIFYPCMAAHGYVQDPSGFGPPAGGVVYMVR
jgi:hypothetical protein